MLPPAATGGDWVLAASARVAGSADGAPCRTTKWAFRFTSAREGAAAAAALTTLRRRAVVVRVAGGGGDTVAATSPPPPPLPRGTALIEAVEAVLASPSFDACVEAVAEAAAGRVCD